MSTKKIVNTFVRVICLVCICILILTSCTNQKNENKAGQKSDGQVDVKAQRDRGIQADKGPDIKTSRQIKLNMGEMYNLGEVVPSARPTNENPENIGLEYIINNVNIFTDADAAGINSEQMVELEPAFDDDGNVLEYDEDNLSLLIFEITVKNINYPHIDGPNITNLSLVYSESSDGDVKMLSYPVYFSNPKTLRRGDDWSEYYNYKLPIGQSMDVKVGWLVDLIRYDKSNLYLCVNFLGEENKRQYIQLDL